MSEEVTQGSEHGSGNEQEQAQVQTLPDKAQAIHTFWSSFGLTAYDENSVPDGAALPYITYSVKTGAIGNMVNLTGSLWYRSTSWATISKKADAIAAAIGYGFKLYELDSGFLFITKGTPFSQRGSDEDPSIRRIYINLNAEFLTAY